MTDGGHDSNHPARADAAPRLPNIDSKSVASGVADPVPIRYELANASLAKKPEFSQNREESGAFLVQISVQLRAVVCT
jgi:hypothetical protein